MAVLSSQLVSAVLPSYNGKHLLEMSLSALRTALPEGSVTVVDDASDDNTAQFLRERFPAVRLIERKTNGGFSAAVNDGIRATGSELVVLLNNDVQVEPGFLDSLLPLFDDGRVFAVTPRILLPGRANLDEACKTAVWRRGILYTGQRQGVGEVSPVLYCTGCAAVYRRSMLEELRLFDEAYSPFYWEDVDLCYRAWKRGWKSLYQPASAVLHQHSASTSRIKRSVTDEVKARNSLLFIWRNIEDRAMLASHRRWLPLVIARRTFAGDTAFVRGWRQAWRRRHGAVQARAADSVARRLSDREIFTAAGVKI